jgi:transposase InsO family protein
MEQCIVVHGQDAVTAADLLNDRVLPFFAEHGIPLSRILTDRGTEYCGTPARHPFELYLALEDIEHTRTKTKHPQTNGICERFNKTLLDEFYRVAFRRKFYEQLEPLQADPRCLRRQPPAAAPGPLVLRQNPDADVSR